MLSKINAVNLVESLVLIVNAKLLSLPFLGDTM